MPCLVEPTVMPLSDLKLFNIPYTVWDEEGQEYECCLLPDLQENNTGAYKASSSSCQHDAALNACSPPDHVVEGCRSEGANLQRQETTTFGWEVTKGGSVMSTVSTEAGIKNRGSKVYLLAASVMENARTSSRQPDKKRSE